MFTTGFGQSLGIVRAGGALAAAACAVGLAVSALPSASASPPTAPASPQSASVGSPASPGEVADSAPDAQTSPNSPASLSPSDTADSANSPEPTPTPTTEPAVNLTAPGRVVALRRVRVEAAVSAQAGPVTVTVQSLERARWRDLRRVTSSAAASDTRLLQIPISLTIPGTASLRAVSRGPAGTLVSPTAKTAVITALDAAVRHVSRSALGRSYRTGCPVGPLRLRQITMNHYGFDGRVHPGVLVGSARAVSAYKRVFARALANRFPIRKMRPTASFGGSDVRAMKADNTSAFNCRHVTGNPYRISQHSYGNAIDINTKENPYVTSSRVYPSSGRPFLRRSPARPGMIRRGDVIAGTMSRMGWLWGARWSNPDYQHFSSNGG